MSVMLIDYHPFTFPVIVFNLLNGGFIMVIHRRRNDPMCDGMSHVISIYADLK